jgi:hypothetical protein
MITWWISRYSFENDKVQSGEVERQTACYYWIKNDKNYKHRPDRRDVKDCFATKNEAIAKMLQNESNKVEYARSRFVEAESDLAKTIEWARQNREESAPHRTTAV